MVFDYRRVRRMRSFKERVEFAKSKAKGNILELGCGENWLFKDSVKLDIAEIKGVIKADLNKNFPINGSRVFDTIIALEVIEHLYNFDGFLEECKGCLKQAGILIISTPNVKYWKNRIWLLAGNDKWFHGGEHYWYFSPESLRRRLKTHALEIEEIRPLGRIKLLSFCGGFVCSVRKC